MASPASPTTVRALGDAGRHAHRGEDHLEQQALDQVILFQATDGQVTLDGRLEADTGWLSPAQMAELTRDVVTTQGFGQPAA
jgi:hypothetical protein